MPDDKFFDFSPEEIAAAEEEITLENIPIFTPEEVEIASTPEIKREEMAIEAYKKMHGQEPTELPTFDITKPQEPRPLEAFQERVTPEDITRAQSVIGGGAKSVTMGWAPEIVGGAKALLGTKDTVFGEPTTKEYIREEDELLKLLEEGNPGYFFGGEIAGTVPAMLLAPGSNPQVGAKNLSLIAKMLRASKGLVTPAIEGFITAAGYSDKEDFIDRLKDGGFGAIFNIGTGAALKGLGVASKKVKEQLVAKGGRFAKRAERYVLDLLGQAGTKRAKTVVSDEAIKQLDIDEKIARKILDDPSVKISNKTRDVLLDIRDTRKRIGKEIGIFYEKLDKLGIDAFNPKKLALELSRKLQFGKYKGKTYKSMRNKLQKTLIDLYNMPTNVKGNITFEAAQDFKRTKIDPVIKNWVRGGKVDMTYASLKDARKGVVDAIKEYAEKAGSEFKDEISNLNEAFSAYKPVDKFAKFWERVQAAKDPSSLLQGATNPWSLNYMAQHAQMTGFTAAINKLKKIVTGYKGTKALLFDFMSKHLEKLPDKSYAIILNNAFKKEGDGAFAMMHALLYNKYKNYKNAFDEFSKEKNNDDEKDKKKAYTSEV